MNRLRAFALGIDLIGASLLGCADQIDAFPHRPPRCELPAVGETCPVPVEGEAAYRAIDVAAWCPPGADLLRDARPGDSFEWACAPADPRPWRIVVGSIDPGWGASYITPDGTLVVCDNSGRVASTHPMLTDDSGRVFQAIEPEDSACLADGSCDMISDPCWVQP